MIGRLLALLIGILGALAASQAPEFAQQYRQRLGGAIGELQRVVSRFDGSAQQSGLSREAAIARLAQGSDAVAREQGQAVAADADRLQRLERQKADFAAAGSFGRLLVLVREADPSLARATYLDFEPAWPATSEGLVTGAAGFAIAWLAMLFGVRIVRRLVPGRRRRERMRRRDLPEVRSV